MSLINTFFYFFMVLAALAALGVLLTKNVFYGALLTIVCLLALAGIYILAYAEFVAIAQILIYAGGILVVILFGIMLTSRISGKPLVVTNRNVFAGSLAAVLLFLLLTKAFQGMTLPYPSMNLPAPNPAGITQVGVNLMTVFVLPFEIAGILLLVALIGAAVTATAKPTAP
jgi:NADH:ubiquinone oxidoreductase subunit 6 (subunit J)